MSSLAFAAALLLAALVGFCIRRGSVCAVGAVEEVVVKGRYRRFMSFFLCSAWVAVVLIPAVWLTGRAEAAPPAYGIYWGSVLGGALFGAGAVVNGGCNFGSVARLGRGETSLLFLFPGLYLGVLAARAIGVAEPDPLPIALWAPGPVSIAWLGLCLVVIVLFTLESVRHKRERRTPGAPVAFYMSVIGGVGAVITLLVGGWQYTLLAMESARAWREVDVGRVEALFAMLIALLAGAVAAGVRDGQFKLRAPEIGQSVASLAGGTMMGAAITLIPGGNDGLVLSAVPALSVSALAAYPAMVACIAALILLSRRLAKT